MSVARGAAQCRIQTRIKAVVDGLSVSVCITHDVKQGRQTRDVSLALYITPARELLEAASIICS